MSSREAEAAMMILILVSLEMSFLMQTSNSTTSDKNPRNFCPTWPLDQRFGAILWKKLWRGFSTFFWNKKKQSLERKKEMCRVPSCNATSKNDAGNWRVQTDYRSPAAGVLLGYLPLPYHSIPTRYSLHTVYCSKGMWGWGEYHILHFRLALNNGIVNPGIQKFISVNCAYTKVKEFKDLDSGYGRTGTHTYETRKICT